MDLKPSGVDLAARLLQLAEPLMVESPCGGSLDDTQALAALEAYRVFGRIKAAGRTEDDLGRAVERRLIELKIIAAP